MVCNQLKYTNTNSQVYLRNTTHKINENENSYVELRGRAVDGYCVYSIGRDWPNWEELM